MSATQGNEVQEDTEEVTVIEVEVTDQKPSGTRDPSRIYFMPIEPTSEMEAKHDDESDVEGHFLFERELRDAWEFETDKKELFDLRSVDTEIEHLIDAGLEAAFEAMDSECATVSGTVVAVMKAMLSNHRALAKYVNGPHRPEIRSVAEIQEELTGEYPRAVRRLMCELYEAVDRTRDPRRYADSRKSTPRRHLWSGMRLPSQLPMDAFAYTMGEEAESIEPESPFNVALINLMDAGRFDEELEFIFSLKANCSDETRIALGAAVQLFLDNMNSPKADVCSLIALMFKKFIRSHPALASDFNFSNEFVTS